MLPAGFIPDEDQGIFGVNVQLPPGASIERTSVLLKKVEDILAKTDGLDSFQTVGGYGAVTSTYQPNYGTIFVRLKPWEERKGEALHVNGIMGRLRPQFAAIPEAIIFPFNIPTLSGFGAALGFNFLLGYAAGRCRSCSWANRHRNSSRRHGNARSSAPCSPRSTRTTRR